jgi:hypothetical protein
MLPWPLLTVGGALVGVVAFAEYLRGCGVPPMHTRQIAHLGAAGVTELAVPVLTLVDVLVLGSAGLVELGCAAGRGWLRSIHEMDRPTLGALAFAAGVMLAALVLWALPAALR